jgi:glycosyltransferase involved in cell wall biosynthesis
MRLSIANSLETARSPLNILHVIDSLSPADGGLPESVRQLVTAQIDAGDGVELVCLDDPDDSFLVGVGCPVHALGPAHLGKYGFSPRLWRWLRGNVGRFDGIVVNGIWTFPGVAVRFASRRAHVAYGVFPHGALDPWFNRSYPLKHLKKRLYWRLQHPVLRDARAVMFTSETERDLAATSFSPCKWKSVVVPIGINDPEERKAKGSEPEGNSSDQMEAFFRALPTLRSRRYLLFLARIHEKKGCDLLIEAFAKVSASVPDVDLVMAGPDQEGMMARLQRQAASLGISSRVHWPGMIGGDLKWGALRGAEAFVLPSHQENFGVAVVESLAAGRPVLISNQVNIWPEIEGDGAGLVDEDTARGCERLMRRWFALSATDRDAMAARARSSFLSRYALRQAVASINHIFWRGGNVREATMTARPR